MIGVISMQQLQEKNKGGRPRTRPSDELILKLYRDLSSRQIGMMYEVSPATVRSWVLRAKQSQSRNEVTARD